MPEKNNGEQKKENDDGTEKGEPWWLQNAIDAMGVRVPVLVFIGVLLGVIVTYLFLVDRPFFIEPLIGNAVRATVEAQMSEIQPGLTPPAASSAAANVSTLTPAAQDSVSIDDFPGRTFQFSSGNASVWLNVIRGEDRDFDYQFIYSMPENSVDDFAGLFFDFTPTIDLTDFESLQIAIGFGDDDAICQVYLEDENDLKTYVSLKRNDSSAVGDAKMEVVGDKTIFTIPIAENFSEPSLQSINGIGISVNAGIIEGHHFCTVHDMQLLRQGSSEN